MLTNAIAVANGKGGVGKTSLTANLGGLAALNGWRVLLVDLDPQGDLGCDLGYGDGLTDGTEHGRALLDAVCSGSSPTPLRSVRDNLDVVTGGAATLDLERHLATGIAADPLAACAVGDALETLAADYNLVLFDCPPAANSLLDAAFAAARFVLVPTRGDAASLNGLARTARRFVEIRERANPALELLGVVLFDFGANDSRLVAKARAQLQDALAGVAPVFEAFIRNSRKGPDDMRELGQLAHEYHDTAKQAPRWFEDRDAASFSASATGLALDYQDVAKEVLTAFTARSV